jgi:hypothetical protein
MGRRIYNLHKNASHERKFLPTVIIMQSFWRQVLCSRAVQAFRKKAGLEDLHIAALHVQRVGKGMAARKATQCLLAHHDIVSKKKFSSGGRAEDHIRKQLDTNFGRPPRPFSLELVRNPQPRMSPMTRKSHSHPPTRTQRNPRLRMQ